MKKSEVRSRLINRKLMENDWRWTIHVYKYKFIYKIKMALPIRGFTG